MVALFPRIKRYHLILSGGTFVSQDLSQVVVHPHQLLHLEGDPAAVGVLQLAGLLGHGEHVHYLVFHAVHAGRCTVLPRNAHLKQALDARPETKTPRG